MGMSEHLWNKQHMITVYKSTNQKHVMILWLFYSDRKIYMTVLHRVNDMLKTDFQEQREKVDPVSSLSVCRVSGV